MSSEQRHEVRNIQYKQGEYIARCSCGWQRATTSAESRETVANEHVRIEEIESAYNRARRQLQDSLWDARNARDETNRSVGRLSEELGQKHMGRLLTGFFVGFLAGMAALSYCDRIT